jgi:hypothetical protein
MKSVDKLFELAAHFEKKLSFKKIAEELGDTAMVNIRPLLNKMLVGREPGGNAPEPPPSDCLKAKILAIVKKGAAGGGDIKVGDRYSFSAKKTGDAWVVTEAHVQATGSLLQDSKIGQALTATVDLFNKISKTRVQQELNRIKTNLGSADTITNMETLIDNFNFEIGD